MTRTIELSGGEARPAKPKTRIQVRNEKSILDAAQIVFAEHGFEGATVDLIARQSGISKPNIHYYFKTKKTLYVAVLTRILDVWLTPLSALDPAREPAEELGRYIAEKVEASRRMPVASRVFANEILHGAPVLKTYLRTELKTMVDQKAKVLRQWIAAGKLAPVDPYHLIFLIWAATQHYADFEPQVRAILDVPRLKPEHFAAAERSILDIILNGVLPKRAR